MISVKTINKNEVVNLSFKFHNGCEVSVALGNGSYSRPPGNHGLSPSRHSVEVAVFNENEDFITRRVYQELFQRDIHDDVVASVTSDELAKVMAFVQAYPAK